MRVEKTRWGTEESTNFKNPFGSFPTNPKIICKGYLEAIIGGGLQIFNSKRSIKETFLKGFFMIEEGSRVKMVYIIENRVLLEYDIPMNEIVTDSTIGFKICH